MRTMPSYLSRQAALGETRAQPGAWRTETTPEGTAEWQRQALEANKANPGFKFSLSRSRPVSTLDGGGDSTALVLGVVGVGVLAIGAFAAYRWKKRKNGRLNGRREDRRDGRRSRRDGRVVLPQCLARMGAGVGLRGHPVPRLRGADAEEAWRTQERSPSEPCA